MDLLTPVHLVIILAIALLLFGPKRLPEIGQGLGKTIREFRKSMQEITDVKEPLTSSATPTPAAPADPSTSTQPAKPEGPQANG